MSWCTTCFSTEEPASSHKYWCTAAMGNVACSHGIFRPDMSELPWANQLLNSCNDQPCDHTILLHNSSLHLTLQHIGLMYQLLILLLASLNFSLQYEYIATNWLQSLTQFPFTLKRFAIEALLPLLSGVLSCLAGITSQEFNLCQQPFHPALSASLCNRASLGNQEPQSVIQPPDNAMDRSGWSGLPEPWGWPVTGWPDCPSCWEINGQCHTFLE